MRSAGALLLVPYLGVAAIGCDVPVSDPSEELEKSGAASQAAFPLDSFEQESEPKPGGTVCVWYFNDETFTGTGVHTIVDSAKDPEGTLEAMGCEIENQRQHVRLVEHRISASVDARCKVHSTTANSFDVTLWFKECV